MPGYPEDGPHRSWRSANDDVFAEAAAAYNREYNLSPSDPDYFTPQRMKAWAMVESGGTYKDFTTDPFQVNNLGDWDDEKAKRCKLTPGQVMTPATSAAAALEWWRYKAYWHDAQGRPYKYKGTETAFRDYNGNKRPHLRYPRMEHRDWYGKEVVRLERLMMDKGEER